MNVVDGLEPCPFCGKYPDFEYGCGNIKRRKGIVGYGQWEIKCKTCSFSRCFRSVALTDDEVKQMAIKWWNTRV